VLPVPIVEMYDNNLAEFDSIVDLIIECSSEFVELLVFIDGIDECEKEERKRLLEVLHRIHRVGIKIFIPSRARLKGEVKSKFPDYIDCEIDTPESDLHMYVDRELSAAGLENLDATDILANAKGRY